MRVACHLVKGNRIWKPTAKKESDDDVDDANGTTPGVQEVDVQPECKEDYDEEDNDDHDEGEDDDFDEEDNDDHDDGMIEQLSHRMAKFLRHTAHKEGLLYEEDWLPLSDALPRLKCNEAELTVAVRLSDRGGDDRSAWGCGARFQMCVSGSTTWIRATDGEYYRSRASTRRA